MVIYRK